MDDNFICRGTCGAGWPVTLKTLDCVSDLAIGASYVFIPLVMIGMLRRFHALFPYRRLWLLYATFILLCGGTHFATVLTYWQPWYWLDAGLKALTALVSLVTVFVLWRTSPLILASLENSALALQYIRAELAEREAKLKASEQQKS